MTYTARSDPLLQVLNDTFCASLFCLDTTNQLHHIKSIICSISPVLRTINWYGKLQPTPDWRVETDREGNINRHASCKLRKKSLKPTHSNNVLSPRRHLPQVFPRDLCASSLFPVGSRSCCRQGVCAELVFSPPHTYEPLPGCYAGLAGSAQCRYSCKTARSDDGTMRGSEANTTVQTTTAVPRKPKRTSRTS